MARAARRRGSKRLDWKVEYRLKGLKLQRKERVWPHPNAHHMVEDPADPYERGGFRNANKAQHRGRRLGERSRQVTCCVGSTDRHVVARRESKGLFSFSS